ncbi:histidine phosphatase family protein [Amycolatopsis saalfeldensis]|uniref:Probable phosphoglycerate mutase n=1 Tax=Amycolatopsis saalfeldensis TaxID=394193 RepID=A0A1H8WCE6_9PSEU|nr:histidine phosphatase family protein [Amycolatopsis saalfeldensis]SEP25316.1 probable phosphoglycerate mutase [Amycolatopsis saalfeldensis]
MGARVLLARHGQTEWHAENRYAGSSEVALTAEGLRQAEALARFAAEVKPTALFCSPQDRARRTIAPAAEALGLTPEIVDDLRETHFGIAEGRTRDEVRAVDPGVIERFLADPVAGSFPGAEDPHVAARRGARAVREIARHGHGLALVVAHNTLLRLTFCHLLGIPLAAYRTVFPQLGNAAVTELEIDGDRTALLRFNLPLDTR